MSKLFKRLSLVLAVVMILGLFAGCNNSNKTNGGQTTGDGSETLNYSEGLNEQGHFEGVAALELVTLPEDYQAINVSRSEYEAKDEDVQSQIDSLTASYSETVQILDRAVIDGDTINMDYSGKIDGVAFDGGTATNQDATIGVSNFIDGFLPQLIGHTPGETFDINVTFPADYQPDPTVAGKAAVFTITLNYIEETVMPTVDDAFVAENLSASHGWNTVEEMRQSVKGDIEKANLSSYIETYLMDNSTVSQIPQSMIDFQANIMVAYYKNMASQYGMEFDQFLSTLAGVSSVDELKEMYTDNLSESAKYSLIIQAISEAQNLSVDDNAVKAYFSENMGTEDYSAYEKAYGSPYIKMVVLNENVMNFLRTNAVIK